MSEDRNIGNGDEQAEESPSRPPPRNPFAEAGPLGDDEALPALIDDRRTAALSGVVVGLIALVLVVALCAVTSYAFR